MRRTLLVALLSAALLPIHAAAAPDHADTEYVKTVARDAGTIAASPVHWDGGDWLEAGAVVGGAGVLYVGADVAAQHAARRNQSRVADGFADVGRGFGNGFYTVPALGAFYLAGEAVRDRRLRRASLDAVESLAIAGLFVTGTKVLAGRDRPYVGDGRGTWNGPGSGNAHYSFPSGHSADAFAVATTFATEYGDVPGAAPAAYALAVLTGLSRIYNDQHWASDVFVGGALGYFTAKSVARAHADKDGRWSFRAYPLPRGAGAAVAYRFE
ncbi:MAG: phosphatase PAP2 family protein [Elusimicrobia bacterium]|nr:phosphatase PAP2 family protein [Elusimicrobiota bacterium]